jgi:uncharacterized protein YdeI (YjbR/CyaY-like superfamily)
MANAATETSLQVDEYIVRAAPFAQPILVHLREIMHEGVPGVEETIKWSRPFFVYRGVILGNISAFREHCSLGLWGSEIASSLRADGIASNEGMGSFGRITSVEDLPARKKLISYVKHAAKMIDEGVRTKSLPPRAKVAKPTAEVPEALAMALINNKIAAKKFETMSPSGRREYCEWIADAKREETRANRVVTAIEWIAAGKSRNWKYEQC